MATDTDLTLSAAAQMPPDLMLLKMENEQIFSVARMQPRDPMKIVGQLQQLIDAWPAAAEEAIYRRPVGSVWRVKCGEKQCGIEYEVVKIDANAECPACGSKKRAGGGQKAQKFAEGLSIRAAENIRAIYGYTRLATVTELDASGVATINGTLVDYAAGNVTSDSRVVSPYYKARDGKMTRTPEDRYLNVTVKAEKSKLRRDVILDNTPGIIKAMFRDACEKKLAELVTPEIVEQKIVPAFAEYGITLAHLEKLLGRTAKLGWRQEERLALKKILSAMKNEETTARELLDGLDDGNKTQAKPSGPVTGDALSKGKATKQPDDPPAEDATPLERPQDAMANEPAKRGLARGIVHQQIASAATLENLNAVHESWYDECQDVDDENWLDQQLSIRAAELKEPKPKGKQKTAFEKSERA